MYTKVVILTEQRKNIIQKAGKRYCAGCLDLDFDLGI